MLTKNQIYTAEIVDYTSEGQGVAKIEGCAVFVPNAIRGEKCRIRIEKIGKTWAAGKITEILEKSPRRALSCSLAFAPRQTQTHAYRFQKFRPCRLCLVRH